MTDDEEICKWDRADYIARTLVLINLNGEEVAHVSHTKYVKEAWGNLKTVHETKSQMSALIAKRTFYSMRAEEDRIIPDHVTDMTKSLIHSSKVWSYVVFSEVWGCNACCNLHNPFTVRCIQPQSFDSRD
ncbi:hypothetical protein K503DRAFT_341178 [Rhizopogon vinicolor AM-OR11-026]|uniref:Uncharacterized protein n=1 Tax=Rhizopogon vinicolor AM-OR11-026 TaxID=1314800 RepID=A0A1B7NCI3_9AGAM|nr:hypothetical protein K503DRAFT_341178 [Rhizopogon vinicolor AM-OR11-026]